MPRTLKEVRKLFGREGFAALRRSWQWSSEYVNNRKRVSDLHRTINNRVHLKAQLEIYGASGQITITTSTLDCDCYQSTRVRTIPTFKSVVEMWRLVENFYDNLEGTGNMIFSTPNGEPDSRVSRDLALEAFEDGHPHIIHM